MRRTFLSDDNQTELSLGWRRVGFTLVELLAVVSIMSIMVLVALLALPNLMKARALTVGTQTMMNTFEYARQLAIVHQNISRVTWQSSQDAPETGMHGKTNAVRVWIRDSLVNPDIHPNGWVRAPGFQEFRTLSPQVAVRVEGRRQLMYEYHSRGYQAGINYTNASGNVAFLNTMVPYLQQVGGAPAFYLDYPYVEFDRIGMPTFTATVLLMQTTATGLLIGDTNLVNYARFIINKGNRNIILERP